MSMSESPDFRIYCSLTTIPSRMSRIQKTIDSLLDQRVMPDKIFIHIPREYSVRFNRARIHPDHIDLLRARYVEYGDRVVFHMVDEDHGPGTKLTGFFETAEFRAAAVSAAAAVGESRAEKYILIVDDDVVYDPHFVEIFVEKIYETGTAANEVYTFSKYHINNLDVRDPIFIAMCVAGFCVKCSLLLDFMEFFEKMRKYDFVLYHDELYMSYFVKLKNVPIVAINNNRSAYSVSENTYVDALNQIQGKYERCSITDGILEVFDKYYPEVLENVRRSHGGGGGASQKVAGISKKMTFS